MSAMTVSSDDAGCGTIPANSRVMRVRKRSSGSTAITRYRGAKARSDGLVFSITVASRCCPCSSSTRSALALDLVEHLLHHRKRLVEQVHGIHDLVRVLEVAGLEVGRVEAEVQRTLGLALHDLLRLARRHLQRDQARRLVLRQRRRRRA